MNRVWVVLVGMVAFPACLFDCLGGGEGAGGGGSTTRITYDLVEATGEWDVTGAVISEGCTTTTSASKLRIALSSPETNAARWSLTSGTLGGSFNVDSVSGGKQGSRSCSGGASHQCPASPEPDHTGSVFFSLSTDPGAVGRDAPGLTVLVPTLSGLSPPGLCDYAQYEVSPRYLRARPITVEALESGRFILEGSGSVPLRPQASSTATVSGALTYSFRFVFQSPDFDAAKAVSPPTLTTFDECLEDVMPTGDELLAAADAVADGGLDVPLNATGCRRIVISRTGGTEVISQRRTVGTRFIVEPSPPAVRSEPNLVTLFRRTADAAGVREEHDFDEDGFFEVTDEHSFSGGAWQSTVARDFAANSSTVLRQLTLTRVDATTMSVRHEVAGQLVDDYVTSTRQDACFNKDSPTDPACDGPPPTGCTGTAPVRCTGAQRRKTIKDIGDALRLGGDCMKSVGFDGFQPGGKGLTLVATDKLRFLCSNNPCESYGSFERAANADGTHDLMVNLVRNGPTELPKTLFHELLHSDPRFTHNETLVRLASKACKLQITDRTYACETMCFAPSRGGACACARCLNPDRSEPPSGELCTRCEKFGSCPARQGTRADGSRGAMSSAVGAFCARGEGQYCDTKPECDSSCAAPCLPLKTVCDPTCN